MSVQATEHPAASAQELIFQRGLKEQTGICQVGRPLGRGCFVQFVDMTATKGTAFIILCK